MRAVNGQTIYEVGDVFYIEGHYELWLLSARKFSGCWEYGFTGLRSGLLFNDQFLRLDPNTWLTQVDLGVLGHINCNKVRYVGSGESLYRDFISSDEGAQFLFGEWESV